MNNQLEVVSNICQKEHFIKRGKDFCRVIGDGVFQVLHYTNKKSPFPVETMDIGLFSLYSDLSKNYFTYNNCYARYNGRHLTVPYWSAWERFEKSPKYYPDDLIDVFIYELHLEDLVDTIIPFLNGIKTQGDYLYGLDFLEYNSNARKPPTIDGAARWDVLRYGPLLYMGRFEEAAEIAEKRLSVNKHNHESKGLSWGEEEYDMLIGKYERLVNLARSKDQHLVEEYLMENYSKSKRLVSFCFKSKNR